MVCTGTDLEIRASGGLYVHCLWLLVKKCIAQLSANTTCPKISGNVGLFNISEAISGLVNGFLRIVMLLSVLRSYKSRQTAIASR